MNIVKRIHKNLNEAISVIDNNKQLYVKNAAKDFTRKRKLTCRDTIEFILSMEGGSLKKELHEICNIRKKSLTASAFIQQRSKISSRAFEDILRHFNLMSDDKRTFKGYKIFAVDGSDINHFRDPSLESFITSSNAPEGYNLTHLNALFDDIEEVKSVATKEKKTILDNVVELNVVDIEPMPNQPRKIFDEKKLQELADSVREHGVIQPIIVEKAENGYHIVAGERRWRAAKIVGLKTMPAIIKDYTESKRKQVALIENIQREDLNVMEVARALKELMELDEYSVSEVAKVTGKSQSAVSNIVRLLKLTPEVQKYVLDGKLVEGQARALLAIEDSEEQIKIANKVIEKKLTVREVEKIIYEDANKYNVKKKKPVKKSSIYSTVEEKLSEYFGMKVKVEANRPNQRLIIEYYNNEGLESVLDKLKIKL